MRHLGIGDPDGSYFGTTHRGDGKGHQDHCGGSKGASQFRSHPKTKSAACALYRSMELSMTLGMKHPRTTYRRDCHPNRSRGCPKCLSRAPGLPALPVPSPLASIYVQPILVVLERVHPLNNLISGPHPKRPDLVLRIESNLAFGKYYLFTLFGVSLHLTHQMTFIENSHHGPKQKGRVPFIPVSSCCFPEKCKSVKSNILNIPSDFKRRSSAAAPDDRETKKNTKTKKSPFQVQASISRRISQR